MVARVGRDHPTRRRTPAQRHRRAHHELTGVSRRPAAAQDHRGELRPSEGDRRFAQAASPWQGEGGLNLYFHHRDPQLSAPATSVGGAFPKLGAEGIERPHVATALGCWRARCRPDCRFSASFGRRIFWSRFSGLAVQQLAREGSVGSGTVPGRPGLCSGHMWSRDQQQRQLDTNQESESSVLGAIMPANSPLTTGHSEC